MHSFFTGIMLSLHLDNLEMAYEPYPVGIISPVFDTTLYQELLQSFPPLALFQYMPRFGNKYSLSEKNNRAAYEDYTAGHPAWREFHRYIKSADFIYAVIDMLRDRNVDLGIRRERQGLGYRWRKVLRNIRHGRLPGTHPPIYSRFEYSVLPAKDGIVVPHTDAPRKFITLVFTMVGDDDWDETWGGGTDILRCKDPAKTYNYYNQSLDYAECDVLRTVPFRPNQAMLFVKTFNSLHGVRAMTGPEGALRRTLTVNIERAY